MAHVLLTEVEGRNAIVLHAHYTASRRDQA